MKIKTNKLTLINVKESDRASGLRPSQPQFSRQPLQTGLAFNLASQKCLPKFNLELPSFFSPGPSTLTLKI